MATILRVNMDDLSIRREEADARYRELGGRGLTSALVARRSAAALPSAVGSQQAGASRPAC